MQKGNIEVGRQTHTRISAETETTHLFVVKSPLLKEGRRRGRGLCLVRVA